MEMKKYKLGEIGDFFNGKIRPAHTGTFPLYGGNGIIDYVNQYNYDNVIIIGRVGAYCGSVTNCNEKCWVSDNAIAFKVNKSYDKTFIYYHLQLLNLNQKHEGAAQPLITQSTLNNIEISLPNLPTQQRIASILSTLDRKITLNRAINRNLAMPDRSSEVAVVRRAA